MTEPTKPRVYADVAPLIEHIREQLSYHLYEQAESEWSHGIPRLLGEYAQILLLLYPEQRTDD